MNQNENEQLTADQTLRKWCEYTYPSLPDAAKMALQTACLSYAAQQVQPIQDYLDATVKNRAKVVYDLKNRLKQVTEERNKAVEILSEALIQLKYLDNRFPTGSTPNVVSRIETFLNSLTIGREAGEK